MSSYLEDCVESLRFASEQLDHATRAHLAYSEQGHGLGQEVVEEVGMDAATGTRPAEVDVVIADNSKARREHGWEPEVGFDGRVEMLGRDRPCAASEGRRQRGPCWGAGGRVVGLLREDARSDSRGTRSRARRAGTPASLADAGTRTSLRRASSMP